MRDGVGDAGGGAGADPGDQTRKQALNRGETPVAPPADSQVGTQVKTQGHLVAVVVTYNRLAQLKETVARLLDTAPEALAALLVVDNASTDGTGDWLAGLDHPRLHVCNTGANLGGAGGFARGMRVALAEHAPDWLVLMDDDGRPEPGALEAFHAADLTGIDGVAAAVYYPDGDICDMNRPSRNPFWHGRVFLRSLVGLGGRNGFHLTPEAYAAGSPRDIDITSFVGCFLRAEAVARIGFPDPDIFIYADDGLYTLGLRKAGGRIVFDPRVRFEHDMRTFAAQAGRLSPLWKVYFYHRNLLFLYRAAAGPVLFWPLLCVVLPKWLLKTGKYAGQRGAYLRLLGRAIRHGITGRRKVDPQAIMAEARALEQQR